MGEIQLPAFDDDNRELYNTNEDWSQAHDLSKENPEMLHELQRLWLIEAVKYQVLPLDDRTGERFNPEVAGRPDLMGDRTSMRLDAKMGHLNEAASPNVKNKSHSITADVEIPEGGADGALAVQGGRFGGWSLYMKEGKLKYCYNFIALQHATVESEASVPAGSHQLRVEFSYDGGGVGKGADLTLYVDGTEVGNGRTEHSIPYLTSLDETLDIGVDDASPVTEDYSTKNGHFTGKINWVQIDLGLDDHSHMIDVEQMISVRMAKQ